VPEREIHETGAERTARLAASLDQSKAPGHEWVPTLVFYAAIHSVEAALADHGVHPEGHHARALAIEDDWGEAASDLFEALRDLSEQWRYSARPPAVGDVRAAKDWTAQLVAAAGVDWPVEGFLALPEVAEETPQDS
jgi:hypothetical protein